MVSTKPTKKSKWDRSLGTSKREQSFATPKDPTLRNHPRKLVRQLKGMDKATLVEYLKGRKK